MAVCVRVNEHIGGAPKVGCNNSPTQIAANLLGPFGVSVDATTVYIASFNAGTISTCPLAGCAGAPTVAAYWTINQGTGSVRTCTLASCASSAMTLANGQANPGSIVLANGVLYWTNYADGIVRSIPIGGGVDQAIATGQQNASGIAVHAGNVYWIDSYAIRTCPVTGCSGPVQEVVQAGGSEVVVTDTAIYWANNTSVWKMVW